MRIWNMDDPINHEFAQAWLRGNWGPEGTSVCKECTASQQTRIQPLGLEWEAGSDRIGDFIWASGFDVAIQEPVFDALLERFCGFEKGPVEMIQEPMLKKPIRRTNRTKPRVWLPYGGPPLFELWITTMVQMHPSSSAALVKECHTCDYKMYHLEGVERQDYQYDASSGKLVNVHTARVSDQGIFVEKADLHDADIFRVAEFPGLILCTDRVKEFIEREGFTNVNFLQYGDVLWAGYYEAFFTDRFPGFFACLSPLM